MRSQLVLGGRFKVYEDGSVNKFFDGVECAARIFYTGKDRKYATVSYYDSGKQRNAYVHRLVAAAFVPNPNNYPQVIHIDGNLRNNAASNLEWATCSMATRRAYETGILNPMATADPCQICGEFTKASDHICPRCKIALKQEANELDRRAEQRDRYSGIDSALLSPTERIYVELAAKGMLASEIAKSVGVSRQCVSVALLYAEKKAVFGRKITKTQENTRIALLRKADKAKSKLESAESALEIAKANYESAEKALQAFERSIYRDEPVQTDSTQ